MTTTEIMGSLPKELTLAGEYYELRWQPTTHYKYVTISYENDRGEVLGVDDTWFYAETEKHYAAHVILQMILHNADIVLSHVWYMNQQDYNDMINHLYSNMMILHAHCNADLGLKTYNQIDTLTMY